MPPPKLHVVSDTSDRNSSEHLADLIAASVEAHPLGLPNLALFSSTQRPQELINWACNISTDVARLQLEIGETFWTEFGRNWSICDGVDHTLMGGIMLAMREWHEPALFSEDDQQFLFELDDTLLVYRGQARPEDLDDPSDVGLSWTLSRDTARRFAANGMRGYRGDDQVVLAATVRREDVCFATNARGEEEVVLWPDAVEALAVAIVESVPPVRT